VPDNTLGAEGSVVTPDVIKGIQGDRIDGGAPRGANLFHSFQEFNVGEGRGAYFANPTGIENILTRVTGGNPSNIFGRLGVLGGANLFFLNPNGIVFGPNASLDIQGSFVATTAERIQLGDSGYFSAAQPQTNSLLSVSPGALFFSEVANQPSSIINQGNLSTGKHLTLSAGNLDLQGQLLSGGDLTLQTQDTVKVRDTIANPFTATSGRNLTIQGNQSVDILALNHPQSKIESGGNLNLVSDGDISGDARFESGGSLSILTLSGTPGNFVSWFDPIIQANGDVLFGNYTGVALKVEATGSIQGGDIRITAPDTAIPADDPDFATLTGRPSVILRAGLPSVNAPNVPQNAGGTGFTASLGLPPGISVGNIYTSSGNGGNGGDIILSAANGSITTGDLDSRSYSDSGNAGQGGAINLTADNGSITTGDLYSFSYSESGDAGQGGTIDLTATNDIFIDGDLYSFSYSESGDAGQGGAISLTANNGSITTGNLRSYSYSVTEGNAGQGGAINLTAANDILIDGDLDSRSYSVDGDAGQGGAIGLTAANDINITGDLLSSSNSVTEGNAGQGGAIGLTADNGSITTGDLYSFSYSVTEGNAGQGGTIGLTAANDINITGVLYSFSYSQLGTAGQGGEISLRTPGGDISGQGNQSTVLSSFSISEQGTAGNGGNVVLEAKNKVSNLEILTLSSDSQSGTVEVTGLGDLLLTNTNIVTSKQVTVPLFSGFITLNIGGEGQSGDVSVTSSGNLTFNNSSIQSDTKGSDPAGNITISSPRLVSFTDSQIISDTTSTGQAGSITLKAPEIQLDSSSRLSAQTSSSGTAGNLTLQPYDGGQTLSVFFQEGAQISASTSSSGQGGNLFVTAPQAITINGNGKLSVETSSAGAGGNLTIETQRLTIQDEAQVSASSSSTNPNGIGGNITVNATQSLELNQASLLAQSNGAAPAGNVTIDTGNLTVTNGTIATSADQSTGGAIKINAGDIRLFGDSDITSRVGSRAGNGGNIKLTADSIVALDDSDILAFARDGQGGNVTLITPAFFGENYRPAPKGTDPNLLENNDRVDINANAAVEGVITITSDTSFIQNSLTELPDNQINTESLLANSCIVRRNESTRGTFFITGTGGLPQRPGDAQMSSFPTVDIETLPSDSTPTNTNPNRPWQKGDPIVEPQGVYRLPNGKLVLSRECSRIQ
jgi:filamentous hemagglutinin family protein